MISNHEGPDAIRLKGLTFENSPYRPLGALSDYVCERLPSDRLNLSDAVALLPDTGALHGMTMREARVGLLDLKMLFVAATVYAASYELREAFGRKVDELNEIMGRPPVRQMTYQEIILDNPDTDLRVFTGGATGHHEMCFYRGHQLIESALGRAIAMMKQAIKNPDIALVMLERVVSICKELERRMKSYAMDLQDFLEFKPFFDTNPDTGEKGPSGAFSAKVQHMDVMLYGKDTPASILHYLNDNRIYFPQRDHHDVMLSYADHQCVMDIPGDDVREAAIEIGKRMINFRRFHFGAVVHHIGHNAIGSAEKGGARQFLQGRIAELNETLNAFKLK